MVKLLGTTQAAILLPLTENGGTGLRSFALPLRHFLRTRGEKTTKFSMTDVNWKRAIWTTITSPPLLRSCVTISLATNQRCSFITRVDGGSWAVPVPKEIKIRRDVSHSNTWHDGRRKCGHTCRPNRHGGSCSYFQWTMKFVDGLSFVGLVY